MIRRSVVLNAVVCSALLFPASGGAATWSVTTGDELTAALAGAHDGDRIALRAGDYRAPRGGWRIRRSIDLSGEGSGDVAEGATRLVPFSPADPVLVLTPPDHGGSNVLEAVYIHDLEIRADQRPAARSPTGHGIAWIQQGARDRNLGPLRLARLSIRDMAGDGIHLAGSDSLNTYLVAPTLSDVVVDGCLGNGLAMYRATVVALFGGYFRTNRLAGCDFSSCADVKVIGAALEGNNAGQGKPQLELANVQGFVVEGCHFEEFGNGPGAIRIGSNGGHVSGCSFVNARGAGSTGIAITNGVAKGVVVGPNTWSRTDVLVTIADSDSFRSCIVFPQTVYDGTAVAARIVVPEAPDRGHVVFASTSNTSNLTAGLALPALSARKRDAMTGASHGGTRREGLVIYNDEEGRLNHWDGQRWVHDVAYFPSDSTSASAPPGGIHVPSILDSKTRNGIPSAQRRKGSLFFNSSTNKFNYWDGAHWKEIDGQPSDDRDAP